MRRRVCVWGPDTSPPGEAVLPHLGAQGAVSRSVLPIWGPLCGGSRAPAGSGTKYNSELCTRSPIPPLTRIRKTILERISEEMRRAFPCEENVTLGYDGSFVSFLDEQLSQFLLPVVFSLILAFGAYSLRSLQEKQRFKHQREKKKGSHEKGRPMVPALMSSEPSQTLSQGTREAKKPGKTAVRESKGQGA